MRAVAHVLDAEGRNEKDGVVLAAEALQSILEADGFGNEKHGGLAVHISKNSLSVADYIVLLMFLLFGSAQLEGRK